MAIKSGYERLDLQYVLTDKKSFKFNPHLYHITQVV